MARAFSANRLGRIPAGSNSTPSGIQQGTMGGIVSGGSKPGRMTFALSDVHYLWVLLLLEVGLLAALRKKFRRYHGG